MKRSFKPTEDNVRVLGRTKDIGDVRYIDYSCSGIEFEFTGTEASVRLCSDLSKWEDIFKPWVAVFIDDEAEPSKRFFLDGDEKVYNLYESKAPHSVKIRLMKMSEAAFAKASIKEIIIEGENEIRPTKPKERRIEFIGDSITCGYGIEGVWNKDTFNTTQENPWKAYAAKTARYFDADFNCVSWSGIGVVTAWTDADEPNTSEWLMPDLYKYVDGGLDRSLENKPFEIWDSSKFVPQVIVINLGTNDASYTKGIEGRVIYFEKKYFEFLKQIRECNPDSEIICTLGIMGQELCPAVERAVSSFKNKTGDNKVHTLFFNVQEESDGIGADWHPSLRTQDKAAKKLISKVKEVMDWKEVK